ncbi:hypothetical protein F6X40_41685 [Paraburkholderia sp. UCT31]|uniref:hypothetical protein n=1 Tax=Paraburkholderia sp. UCT31 TaxID=2615209 RepID=UPI001655BCB6|nr:hypothetical protein [Paraburkholderia sp. UCT31]MBC8742967.1 hypothetical protein [Paraburkholderia sp. UCT31]
MESAFSKPTYFQHEDGGIYRFFTLAPQTEGAGEHAVYEHVWPFAVKPAVRPTSLWSLRFRAISDIEANSAMAGNREEAQAAVTAAKAARKARAGASAEVIPKTAQTPRNAATRAAFAEVTDDPNFQRECILGELEVKLKTLRSELAAAGNMRAQELTRESIALVEALAGPHA